MRKYVKIANTGMKLMILKEVAADFQAGSTRLITTTAESSRSVMGNDKERMVNCWSDCTYFWVYHNCICSTGKRIIFRVGEHHD